MSVSDAHAGRTASATAEAAPAPEPATAPGPLPPNVYSRGCASRPILEHVTSRWGVLVLAVLLRRSYRFSELRREIGGVSEKMLAQTLQTLERDGFVDRDAKPVIPPRVDYSLTPLGREVAKQVSALARWVEGHVEEVVAARADYDEARHA